jgi:hypothetical protein
MEKLRSVAPAGATVRLYKDMDDFKAAFQDGKNLEWIKKELESVPGATHAARVPDGYSKLFQVGGEQFLPAQRMPQIVEQQVVLH